VIKMNREKLNPKIRFYGFITDWEQRKFHEIGVLNRGKSKHRPRNDVRLYNGNGEFPFIQTGDVAKAGLFLTKYSQTYSDFGIQQSKFWDKGTLLITIAANIAETSILGIKAAFPDSIIGFNSNKVDMIFIKNIIDNASNTLRRKAETSSQANLNLAKLSDLDISLPTLEEQIKIGDFFKQLDNAMILQQQLLNNHKQLKKAMLQKMFPKKGASVPEIRFDGFNGNWKKINLGKLVELSSGINGNVSLNNGKYKLTRIETISNGKVNFNKVGFTNELPERKYLLNKGDILYSNINSLAHIGKIAKYNLNYELYHGINLLRLSPKHILNSDFLYQYLNTVVAKQWAVSHANQAVNQASINQTELSKQLVHISNYEEQTKIGDFFKQLDETISFHEKKLETYQELKKAMLQKMFV